MGRLANFGAMILVISCAYPTMATSHAVAARQRSVRRVKVSPSASHRLVTVSAVGGASSTSAGRQKKVALLFRGEAFRGDRTRPTGEDMEHKLRANCEESSVKGFYTQKLATTSHNEFAAKLAKLGMQVDIYGVTYPCKNGLNYTSGLPEMYTLGMKAFDIIPFEGSSQGTTMTHVLKKALASGEKYDGIYILRWDYSYGFLARHDEVSCLLDSSPRNMLDFLGGNPDGLLYIPGPYADAMLAFMELGWDGDSSQKAGCCNKVQCSMCAKNFLMYAEKKDVGWCSHRPCIPGCGMGSLHEARLHAPRPPSWLMALDTEVQPMT